MIRFILFLLLIPSLCFSDSETTIGGKTAQAHIIQNNGTSLRPRPYLNLTGSGVSCSDTGGKTVCTISGGGGSGISGLTTNYIPKATSDTVISNSRLLDDGTNFVFGTNNSTSALDSFTFHSTTGGITLNGPISGIGGIDGFTKVMLHLNNDIVDAALTPNTFTNNGSIAFTNTSPPFSGKYWAVFDGGGTKSLSTPANTAFDLGSSVWTIDFVVKWNTHLATGAFLGQSSGANDYWWVAWSFGSTRLFFQHVAGGIVTGQFHSASFTPVNGTQYHIAFERTGANTGMIFINGVSQAVTIDTTLSTIAHETGNLTLGANSSFANDPDANIAEVRFSPGVVRWSSDFTPPATEYTNSALAMPFAFAVNSSTIAQIIGSSIDGTLKFKNNGVTAQTIDSSGGTAFGGNITTSTHNIVTDTTTGTSFGSGTTQKTSAYGVTPVVQGLATTDLGTILSNWGLRASGTAYPITTSGTVNLSGLTLTTPLALDGSKNVISGSYSGNTTQVATVTGSKTSGSLTKFDASGNVVTAALIPGTLTDGKVCTYTASGTSLDCNTSASGTGTVTNTGGSLTSNSVVLGAGTNDTKVVAGIITDGVSQLNLGVNTTTLGKLKLFGNTSGDVTVQPSAVAGTATVLTLPATTDTLSGKATVDTFTNKTYDTAGTGNSFSINGVAATDNSGTGKVVRDTSPTLVTPVLGAATGTSLSMNSGSTVMNGNGFSTTAGNTTGAAFSGTQASLTTGAVFSGSSSSNSYTGTGLLRITYSGTNSGVVASLNNSNASSSGDTLKIDNAGTGNAINVNTGTVLITPLTASSLVATDSNKKLVSVTKPSGAIVGDTDTQTLTNKTMSYAVASGAGTYKGNIITFTSAETQAIGDAVQIDGSGNAHLAKADTIGHASVVLLAAAAVSGSASNTYLLPGGTLKLSSSPSWTVGGLVYLSTTGTTGNTLTQTAPSGTSNSIQILGVAVAADTLLFMPSLSQVEHT